MTKFTYRCSDCGRVYKRDEVTYLCPVCSENYSPGMPLKGVILADFDYEDIARKYNANNPDINLFLAVEEKFFPKYPVGNTPFFKADRLGRQSGFDSLWIKNDGLNPSGSLKDRASWLMVAEAIRKNNEKIVTASTGNAASALAAVCASAGKKAVIFVPESAPKAKLTQIVQYGAEIILVNGSYDDAFSLSLEYTEKYGGLNRNTAYHPLTIEGKKTAGLEIFFQNNQKVPDAIIIPVGDGVIITGIYKAFYDLKKTGLIEKLPKLIAVQAESSAAIHKFIETGNYHNEENPNTIADSISVSCPSNALLAKQAIMESCGFSITVSDNEILEGQKLLASSSGIFAEPAAATTAAALKIIADKDLLKLSEQIVLLITGSGLKDIDTAMKGISFPEAL